MSNDEHESRRDAQRVVIRQLATGVPGLDRVLGGGVPEYSFNLIAGSPGTGKTTLAQQIMFANATRERPALHFTVLGEPSLKMLRYQQQFRFFDMNRVGTEIRLLNLSDEALEHDHDAVLARIAAEVERANPCIIVVDSFRTVAVPYETTFGDTALQHFVQRLAMQLTSWEATTFLIGEYTPDDSRNPIFTVADGVLWLTNEVDRNSTVRKLRVTKMRGQESQPGLHTMRISSGGVEVYPRNDAPLASRDARAPRRASAKDRPAVRRLSSGIPVLDDMMGGGIPVGDSVLIMGPTGSGKTIAATQFVSDAVRHGERAVIAVFEEHPESYIDRADKLGFGMSDMVRAGTVDALYLRPLDLSVDEALQTIRDRVERMSATIVIIDSLSGFEVALAPSFKEDFREAFYRLIRALTALQITVLSTLEISESTGVMQFSPYAISFLTDDIIAHRYVELDGQLRPVLTVVKMRNSQHSRDFRTYSITPHGAVMGERLTRYRGILAGILTEIPELLSRSSGDADEHPK